MRGKLEREDALGQRLPALSVSCRSGALDETERAAARSTKPRAAASTAYESLGTTFRLFVDLGEEGGGKVTLASVWENGDNILARVFGTCR